jgi:hypothetical protein
VSKLIAFGTALTLFLPPRNGWVLDHGRLTAPEDGQPAVNGVTSS